eukprot:scaffold24264_cov64-Phaeocystis_antarctica.AAC.2
MTKVWQSRGLAYATPLSRVVHRGAALHLDDELAARCLARRHAGKVHRSLCAVLSGRVGLSVVLVEHVARAEDGRPAIAPLDEPRAREHDDELGGRRVVPRVVARHLRDERGLDDEVRGAELPHVLRRAAVALPLEATEAQALRDAGAAISTHPKLVVLDDALETSGRRPSRWVVLLWPQQPQDGGGTAGGTTGGAGDLTTCELHPTPAMREKDSRKCVASREGVVKFAGQHGAQIAERERALHV